MRDSLDAMNMLFSTWDQHPPYLLPRSKLSFISMLTGLGAIIYQSLELCELCTIIVSL